MPADQSKNMIRLLFVSAEPKLSPGVYQNTPIASIPVSPPPPLERVFASPTIKSESIFQEGNHVTNQWTNPGTPKRENETRSPRGGSGSALHKILDPSWSPDSTTPMDIASAVRYILQVGIFLRLALVGCSSGILFSICPALLSLPSVVLYLSGFPFSSICRSLYRRLSFLFHLSFSISPALLSLPSVVLYISGSPFSSISPLRVLTSAFSSGLQITQSTVFTWILKCLCKLSLLRSPKASPPSFYQFSLGDNLCSCQK